MADLLSVLQIGEIGEIQRRMAIANANDVNLQDDSGRTPLHLACSLPPAHSASIIEGLIAKGARLDVANTHGTTPLHKAVITNNAEAALLLLRRGANLEIINAKGLTALQLAKTDAFADAMRQAAAQAQSRSSASGLADADGTLSACAASTASDPRFGSTSLAAADAAA